MQRSTQASGLILIFMAAVMASGGCVAIKAAKYEVLNNSSQSLLANTSDTFTRIEKLQRRFTVVTAPDSEIGIDTFKPQIEGKSFDLTPELRFRESAFEVLVKYLTLLSALSSKDSWSDVDKASLELGGSLKNLIDTSKVSEKDDASKTLEITNAFAALIGRQVGQRQRSGALTETMDLGQDTVGKLCRLITKSNDKIGEFVRIMVKTIVVHSNNARPAYGTSGRYPFDAAVAEIIAESEEIDVSLKVAQRAVSHIPEALREVRADTDRKTTSFEALYSLIQEAQQANKFYRRVNVK